MLQITPQQQLYISIDHVDFRKGIDGLRVMCQRIWEQDPFSGHLFIFRNRSSTAVKLLIFDGNGFWLCQKRFSAGKLKWWPKTPKEAAEIRSVELLIMLQQGDPLLVNAPLPWRNLTVAQ